MVKSMTGFGRCEVSEGERKMTVEMKSVNHRYLDVAIKMPKKLNYFESAIRSLLKTYIQRGRWTSSSPTRICRRAIWRSIIIKRLPRNI